jgi:hypothetical protein
MRSEVEWRHGLMPRLAQMLCQLWREHRVDETARKQAMTFPGIAFSALECEIVGAHASLHLVVVSRRVVEGDDHLPFVDAELRRECANALCLRSLGLAQRRDNLPDIGAACERGPPARRTWFEDDVRVLLYGEGLAQQSLHLSGQGRSFRLSQGGEAR